MRKTTQRMVTVLGAALLLSVTAAGSAQAQVSQQYMAPFSCGAPLNLDPVQLCQDREEVTHFTKNLGYLRLILRAAGSRIPLDQLLVAHINDVYLIRGQDVVWATAAVHELIELLRSDYETLIPTLEALSETLPTLEINV